MDHSIAKACAREFRPLDTVLFHVARVAISGERLAELLSCPGHVVTLVQRCDCVGSHFNLQIEGPDMPAMQDGRSLEGKEVVFEQLAEYLAHHKRSAE